MTYNIELPGIGTKEKTLKDSIINLLAVEWPLTLTKIYNQLRKNHKVQVTNQAVYKALQELTEKNILTKNNKEYSLDISWIKNVREFSKKAEDSYIEKNPLIGNNFTQNKEIQSFTLDNLYNLDIFLMSYIEKFLTTKEFENTPCYSNWQFGWWPLFISKKEYQVLTKILNPKRIYMTIADKSVVTRFCSNFYSKIGAKIKIGVQLENTIDFMVLDDYIFQIYFPKKLTNKILSLFNSIKNLEELDMSQLFEISKEKIPITVMIIKNKNIAEELSEKVKSQFML